ncbi:uncharacterized protein UV8b_04228 [Ustilaginoidea virens]|uniref:Uncharacterized protein n=1 Tax=Ustilaginoidea virens TaxID=1159556 RepID=A0A8E5MHW2_USTVR|nr:uncharacterized protein UV8b_04228 [Ustilaginoidea virens]QUC19987.1 hypothetical protein UV8b_04228 [Ustilaginoidea virens]
MANELATWRGSQSMWHHSLTAPWTWTWVKWLAHGRPWPATDVRRAPEVTSHNNSSTSNGSTSNNSNNSTSSTSSTSNNSQGNPSLKRRQLPGPALRVPQTG